uniref:Uncharacterized protein n=1 Tax=Rhizophora mucronata TaxID=61149 RepID=A0A2P2IKC3_RHIMU
MLSTCLLHSVTVIVVASYKIQVLDEKGCWTGLLGAWLMESHSRFCSCHFYLLIIGKVTPNRILARLQQKGKEGAQDRIILCNIIRETLDLPLPRLSGTTITAD